MEKPTLEFTDLQNKDFFGHHKKFKTNKYEIQKGEKGTYAVAVSPNGTRCSRPLSKDQIRTIKNKPTTIITGYAKNSPMARFHANEAKKKGQQVIQL